MNQANEAETDGESSRPPTVSTAAQMRSSVVPSFSSARFSDNATSSRGVPLSSATSSVFMFDGGSWTEPGPSRTTWSGPPDRKTNNSDLRSRLLDELKFINENPIANCACGPKDDSLRCWMIVIDGPKNSPYSKGTFFFEIWFGNAHELREYPFSPPTDLFCLTRVYHPMIDQTGNVRLPVLNREFWRPTFTIRQICEQLVDMFVNVADQPTCPVDEALVPELARQVIEDRKQFERIAREWTKRFAM